MARTFDPGFGQKYAHNTKRIINKDGTFNITRKGIRKQWFQQLVEMSSAQFVLLTSIVYILINVAFALIYVLVGVENLAFYSTKFELHPFLKAFFFSMQTFTTVGFGSIWPEDSLSNLVSGIEAMTGWMFFALATGLVYRRFSRPTARILFSNNALIAPYRGGKAIMFRLVNRRPNVLMEMHARVMLAVDMDEGEEVNRRYFNLALETNSIHFFPLSWTVVHPLTENSPVYGFTQKDFQNKNVEILILVKGFDETFSQDVHIRFSYTYDELVWNAKFVRNFKSLDNGQIELDIDGVHNYKLVNDSK